MASPRSARRFSESPRQDKHGQGVFFLFFFIWSCSQWGNLLAGCQETEQLHVRHKIQDFKNVMTWVPSVKNIVYGWHKIIKILLYQIIVSFELWIHERLNVIVYINSRVLKLLCVSCLKRKKNANHRAINYENIVFPFVCYCVFFLCRHVLNLLREKNK